MKLKLFFPSLTGPEVNFFWWKKWFLPRNQVKKTAKTFFWRTPFLVRF